MQENSALYLYKKQVNNYDSIGNKNSFGHTYVKIRTCLMYVNLEAKRDICL